LKAPLGPGRIQLALHPQIMSPIKFRCQEQRPQIILMISQAVQTSVLQCGKAAIQLLPETSCAWMQELATTELAIKVSTWTTPQKRCPPIHHTVNRHQASTVNLRTSHNLARIRPLRTSERPHFCSEQPSSDRISQEEESPGTPSIAHFANRLCFAFLVVIPEGDLLYLQLLLLLTHTKESSFRPKLLTFFVSSAAEKSASLPGALPKATHSIALTIAAKYFRHFLPKNRMSSPKVT